MATTPNTSLVYDHGYLDLRPRPEYQFTFDTGTDIPYADGDLLDHITENTKANQNIENNPINLTQNDDMDTHDHQGTIQDLDLNNTSEDQFQNGINQNTKKRKVRHNHQTNLTDTSVSDESQISIQQPNPQSPAKEPIEILLLPTNKDISLSRTYNINQVSKLLDEQGYPPSRLRRVGQGYLLTTNDKHYAQTLKSISKVGNIHIKAVTPNWQNQIKGVVRWEKDFSDTDIQNAINKANRSKKQAEILTFSRILSNSNPTASIILTFKGTTLPTCITFGGRLDMKVEPLLRKPTICTRCLQYGHTKTACQNAANCNKCGYAGHDYQNCRYGKYCIHCNTPGHTSLSYTCPIKKGKIQNLNKHNNRPSKLIDKSIHIPRARQQTRAPANTYSPANSPHRRPRSSTPTTPETSYNEEQQFSKKTIPNMDSPNTQNKLQKTLDRIEQNFRAETAKTNSATQPVKSNLTVTLNNNQTKRKVVQNKSTQQTSNNSSHSKLHTQSTQKNNTQLTNTNNMVEFITKILLTLTPEYTNHQKQKLVYNIFITATDQQLYSSNLDTLKVAVGLPRKIYNKPNTRPGRNRNSRANISLPIFETYS